jgi:hypothetical protein
LLEAQICRELQTFNMISLAIGKEARTHIHLDGYILVHPMRREITLTYKTDKIRAVAEAHGLERPIGYGSPMIWDILFGTAPDNRLLPYRQICQSNPVTLLHAIRVCEAAVRAHCDPEALTIDRKNCGSVGGRIRIATVTPKEGFKFVSDQKGL